MRVRDKRKQQKEQKAQKLTDKQKVNKKMNLPTIGLPDLLVYQLIF